MQNISIIKNLLLLCSLFLSVPQASAQSHKGAGNKESTLKARSDMKATCYDDGLSCPGGCDSHVVFDSRLNGTLNAYEPGSRTAPKKCTNGKKCTICFDSEKDNCITVMYRGGGPHIERFDFTPAFYEEWCSKEKLPKKLRSQCKTMEAVSKRYESKTNCLANPEHEDCKSLIEEKLKEYTADKKDLDECLKVGQEKFNDTVTVERKRKWGCKYLANKKEKNSKGQTWSRLGPAACGNGSYVGKWGTDCCSSSAYSLACAGAAECSMYYK